MTWLNYAYQPKTAVIPGNPTDQDQSWHFITLLNPACSPPPTSILLEPNLKEKYCIYYQILE
jgi:hypothetical protein